MDGVAVPPCGVRWDTVGPAARGNVCTSRRCRRARGGGAVVEGSTRALTHTHPPPVSTVGRTTPMRCQQDHQSTDSPCVSRPMPPATTPDRFWGTGFVECPSCECLDARCTSVETESHSTQYIVGRPLEIVDGFTYRSQCECLGPVVTYNDFLVMSLKHEGCYQATPACPARHTVNRCGRQGEIHTHGFSDHTNFLISYSSTSQGLK